MKVVFITGGSEGIGAACVVKFITQGWQVGFMDVDLVAADTLMRTLNAPERLFFIAGNICNRADIQHAVDATIARFGQLSSVVANAGIHRRNTLLDITDQELDFMIQTNIYGTVNTLRETIPHLIASGGGSVVINASDQWFVGRPASFAYGLTQGALGQMTRSLSIDLGSKNIRVNAVCASTTRTHMTDDVFSTFAEKDDCSIEQYWEKENALYARESAGEPVEVAEMIYFLADDVSSFCTGSHYLVDGGLTAR